MSTDTIRMPVMKAFTRDTQEVTLQISLACRVPPSAARHLLCEVGRAGGVDGFVRQMKAQAALNWKGAVPQVMGGAGTQMPIVLPLQPEPEPNPY